LAPKWAGPYSNLLKFTKLLSVEISNLQKYKGNTAVYEDDHLCTSLTFNKLKLNYYVYIL